MFHVERFKKFLTWRKDYYYDPAAARRAVEFFHNHLKHTKAHFAGEAFKLEPWQQKVVRRIFGWKRRSDHTRKFRVVFIFIPRKNGKSTLGAGLALYLLHADKEVGAEIVSAAAETEQANILFSIAKDMNDGDPLLASRAVSFRRSLVVHKTGSVYKVITAEAKSKHGGNLHGILFDELHAQKDRELYDVLRTSTAARRQPLEIYMTTAGFDPNSICYEVYEYAKKVLDGSIDDPSFLPVIFEAGPEDDWTKEETWKKANPNYGISVTKEYFEKEVRDALVRPAYENTFKRLHLNVWTEQDVRAISMRQWKKCGELPFDPEDLAGKPCWIGLDLASKQDLCALAALFKLAPSEYAAIMRFWCPQETIRERVREKRHPWDAWIRDGYLTPCKGATNDFELVRQEVLKLWNVYDIREVASDPWNALELLKNLDGDGLTCVEVRQGFFSLTDPTKEFLAAIAEVKFHHGNNPVLTWNASNLATEEDAAGNLKPSKKASPEKIDGCVAIITALSRAIVAEDKESVYRKRGIRVL